MYISVSVKLFLVADASANEPLLKGWGGETGEKGAICELGATGGT